MRKMYTKLKENHVFYANFSRVAIHLLQKVSISENQQRVGSFKKAKSNFITHKIPAFDLSTSH